MKSWHANNVSWRCSTLFASTRVHSRFRTDFYRRFQSWKIIRWDEVRDRLAELNELGLVEPEIRFTKTMKAEREQRSAEFGKWCEETTGGGFNWSFADEFYDSTTSDEDLRPTASRRIGTVIADGLPVADAEIVVYTPDDGRNHEVCIEHGRLRSLADERVPTHSAPNGRFAIYPQSDKFQILVLHEKGMALVNSDQWSNQANIELQRWASITGKFDRPVEFDESAHFETRFETPGWATIALEVWMWKNEAITVESGEWIK